MSSPITKIFFVREAMLSQIFTFLHFDSQKKITQKKLWEVQRKMCGKVPPLSMNFITYLSP